MSLFQPALKKSTLLALAIAQLSQLVGTNAHAAPEGGQVVAGQGVIEQAEKETRIQQASDRLSIDWKSFDVNSDERVQFIQPNSSSIAFNRILSNKGSLIQGKIDANGQVVLINPNGLIFTEGASVNAGGLIASALQMSDQDYLNGKFTLNALDGSEGRVINSGLLTAASGGNISLLGQSVENKGLISAQLGSINLAAGKEAVLTFEPNGLVGVRVSEAVLQNDLGVDAAIINSGEIKAEGGKVLITASISKEIFSQAVNVGELSAAKSAVVNDDGSFTLGAGADVINTGDVSVAAQSNAGEVVLIGENITNQGHVSANSIRGDAGKIEITAKNTNEIRQSGSVTAVAQELGIGGGIKMLGDKVGVLDEARIDVSGAQGGGKALIGGDEQGQNNQIRNARFVFAGENTHIHADGVILGKGGTIILFAEDTARIFGKTSSVGGEQGGDGGYVETSGLRGFEISESPLVHAPSGKSGSWLIDPYNISISDQGNTNIGNDTQNFYANRNNSTILVSTIGNAISNGANIIIQTSKNSGDTGTQLGNITLSSALSLNGATGARLILNAHNNIDTGGRAISVTGNSLSFELNADFDEDGKGVVLLGSSDISTGGGSFKIKAGQNNIINNVTVNSAIELGGASVNSGAGQIIIDAAGDINFAKGGVASALTTNGANIEINNSNNSSQRGAVLFGGGTLTTAGGNLVINTGLNSGTNASFSAKDATLNTSATNGAGDITIDAKGDVSLGALNLSRTFDSTATKSGSLTATSQGSIGFEKDLDFNNFSAYNGANSSNENWTLPNNTPEADKKTTFTLNAAGDINFKGNIFDSYGDGRDGLNIVANADAEVMTGGKDGTGSVIVGNTVYTSGGNVQLTGAGIQFGSTALIDTDRANSSPDNSVTGNGGHGNATRSEGGNVTLSSDSNIVLGSITTDHFCTLGTCTGDLAIQNRSSDKSISITQSAGKALSVHGTTTLKTNGGAITLGEAGNIFGTTGANAGTNSNANNIDTLVTNAKVAVGRTIAITNAGNSTIKGDNSFLTLGNVSAQGLSLFTTKDIRQIASTSIDVNTAAFKGTSVLLINSGNKLGTVTSLETTATSAGTASINTIQDITLSALNIASGQLGLSMADGKSATFDGAITANSAFTVTASGANTTANLADSLNKTGGSTVTFAGFNTLHYTGANEASWNLTSAAQTVSWSGKTFKFDTATSLVGGSGVDKFLLSGTPYSLPTLDGADGDDELTVNAASATANKTWSVELDSAGAPAEGKIRATNIKSLTVTNAQSNTVQLGIGNGKDTTWNLTGATTTYTLNNADLGEVEFTGFNQVAGGDGKDVFDFSNGGSQIFAGKVDGAGGAEDAIKGFNADTAWDLTSTTANFYKTADSGKKYNFSGVEKLIGGTAKDSVTLASTVTEVSLDAFSTGF